LYPIERPNLITVGLSTNTFRPWSIPGLFFNY
jgi:hypothetical protein